MMRVTQMMLAQTQVHLRLGREWRFDAARDGAGDSVYMEICRRFCDLPDARLSLHAFVTRGKEVLGKKPSTWFGPTSGAQVGAALVNAERPDGLRAACFTDGVLYRKPILDALGEGAAGVLVLLCRKLGVGEFNAERYRRPVKACFASPHFVGLASGGPMTSAYFFAAADDSQLYYLDPHTETRPAFVADEEALRLHAARPLRLSWEALNPSMCLGFLVRSPEDLAELAAYLIAADGELFEVYDEKAQYSAEERNVNEDDEFLVLELPGGARGGGRLEHGQDVPARRAVGSVQLADRSEPVGTRLCARFCLSRERASVAVVRLYRAGPPVSCARRCTSDPLCEGPRRVGLRRAFE